MSNETVDDKTPFDAEETGQPATEKARHFSSQTEPNDGNERNPTYGGANGKDTQDSASGDPDSSDSGPKNRKPLIWVAVGCAIALLVVAIAVSQTCRHEEWVPATCSEPKTCAECGATEGEPLGHDWLEATCTLPKRCSRCSETEGFSIGHMPMDWVDEGIDYVSGTTRRACYCERCGEQLGYDETPFTSSYMEGGVFLFSPYDFSRCMDEHIASYDSSLGAAAGELNGNVAVAITENGSQIAGVMFLDSSEELLGSIKEYRERSFSKIVLMLTSDFDAEAMGNMLLAVIQSCDPTLSDSEVRDAALTCTSSGSLVGTVDLNGIHYALGVIDGSWMITATPA